MTSSKVPVKVDNDSLVLVLDVGSKRSKFIIIIS